MQTKLQSLAEACANTAIGLILAMLLNALLMGAVGLEATATQNAIIVIGHTVVSVLRSYAIRRFFTRQEFKVFEDIFKIFIVIVSSMRLSLSVALAVVVLLSFLAWSIYPAYGCNGTVVRGALRFVCITK